MTNRIPQEQIEADKLLCDIIRGIMGQVPIDVHLKYILALEEAYKEIEKLEMENLHLKASEDLIHQFDSIAFNQIKNCGPTKPKE